jgi:hypothetical protein
VSIEEIERFNVVGNELRKLSEKMDRLIQRQGLMEVAAKERGQRIEAQLTALRADADKGREMQERIEAWQKGASVLLAGVVDMGRARKKQREHRSKKKGAR